METEKIDEKNNESKGKELTTLCNPCHPKRNGPGRPEIARGANARTDKQTKPSIAAYIIRQA